MFLIFFNSILYIFRMNPLKKNLLERLALRNISATTTTNTPSVHPSWVSLFGKFASATTTIPTTTTTIQTTTQTTKRQFFFESDWLQKPPPASFFSSLTTTQATQPSPMAVLTFAALGPFMKVILIIVFLLIASCTCLFMGCMIHFCCKPWQRLIGCEADHSLAHRPGPEAESASQQRPRQQQKKEAMLARTSSGQSKRSPRQTRSGLKKPTLLYTTDGRAYHVEERFSKIDCSSTEPFED